LLTVRLLKASSALIGKTALSVGCVVKETLNLERHRPQLIKQGMFRWLGLCTRARINNGEDKKPSPWIRAFDPKRKTSVQIPQSQTDGYANLRI